jgi:hypothetical protein
MKLFLPSEKACFLAANVKESGAWLNVIPSRNLGTLLDNESFRIAVSLRLGLTICHPHTCKCGKDIDEFARHGLACKKSAGRRSRHDSVNDLIKRALISANIPSIMEPLGCARNDGKRPDGLTLIPWSKGRCMVWDFTCTDTYAGSYINETSITPGSAAIKAEERKSKKYENLINDFIFIPVAIETSGIWGPQALKLIHEIGKKIRIATGEARSTSYLIQRISIAIQRGNAASILGATPQLRGLEEVYYVLKEPSNHISQNIACNSSVLVANSDIGIVRSD